MNELIFEPEFQAYMLLYLTLKSLTIDNTNHLIDTMQDDTTKNLGSIEDYPVETSVELQGAACSVTGTTLIIGEE